jgi:hypothetical protein
MILWKRAALLGLLSWLMPFVVSFILFPLKKANAPLFGNLMSLVVLLTGAALLNRISGSTAAGCHGADIVCAMCRLSSGTSIHRGTPSREICRP